MKRMFSYLVPCLLIPILAPDLLADERNFETQRIKVVMGRSSQAV
jgi:hypothetical protein